MMTLVLMEHDDIQQPLLDPVETSMDGCTYGSPREYNSVTMVDSTTEFNTVDHTFALSDNAVRSNA